MLRNASDILYYGSSIYNVFLGYFTLMNLDLICVFLWIDFKRLTWCINLV